MNPNLLSHHFTLDYDGITYQELCRRTDFIADTLRSIRKMEVYLSPTKGYHIRIECFGPVHVSNMRNIYKDDGNRLVNDILNRPTHIHDVLWTVKTIDGIRWSSKRLLTWRFSKKHGNRRNNAIHSSADNNHNIGLPERQGLIESVRA